MDIQNYSNTYRVMCEVEELAITTDNMYSKIRIRSITTNEDRYNNSSNLNSVKTIIGHFVPTKDVSWISVEENTRQAKIRRLLKHL